MIRVLQAAMAFCLVLGLFIMSAHTIEAGMSKKSAAVAEEIELNDLRLGMDYYHKKQYKQAIKYFIQAADRGDVQAILQLGLMYDFGKGVQQSYPEAMRLYLQAAEKGEQRALYLVGHMYEFGEGVAVDITQATHWYLKSAHQGYASAQFELGRLMTSNSSDSQSYHDGIKWLRMAADQCHSQAVELLQSVANEPEGARFCSGG